MAMGQNFENTILQLIFNNVNAANIATGSGVTSLYVSLHTADPSAGNQNTSEATYSGYARVALTRNTNATTGWTVTANNAVNAGTITFPACNGANNSTVTNVAIGANTTGVAGQIFYAGALTSNLAVSNGITPSFAASALTVNQA